MVGRKETYPTGELADAARSFQEAYADVAGSDSASRQVGRLRRTGKNVFSTGSFANEPRSVSFRSDRAHSEASPGKRVADDAACLDKVTQQHFSLLKKLVETKELEFAQLLGLLEKLSARFAGSKGRLRVHFKSVQSLSFPNRHYQLCTNLFESSYQDFVTGQIWLEIAVHHMGLQSSDSPLPPHYIERLLQEDEAGGIPEFLDLLNAKFINLHSRAWEAHQLERLLGSVSIGENIAALSGHPGFQRLNRELAQWFEPGLLTRLYPLLSFSSSSVELVGKALNLLYPGKTFHLEECAWGEVEMDDAIQWQLGSDSQGGLLDETLVVGQRIESPEHFIEVYIGGVSADEAYDFQAGGKEFVKLRKTLECLLDTDLECTLKLAIPLAWRKPSQLAGKETGSRLGVSFSLGEVATTESLQVRMRLNQ